MSKPNFIVGVVLAIGLLAATLSLAQIELPTCPNNYRATVLRVLDGDTFEAMIELGFRVHTKQRIRVLKLDTPESFRPRNEFEKAHGEQAKEYATALLLDRNVILEVERTRNGNIKTTLSRYLASVRLPDGRDFAEVMVEAGFEKQESYLAVGEILVDDGVLLK